MIKEIIGLQKIDFKLQDIESLLGDLPLKVDALINEEKTLIQSVEKGKDRLKELELELNKCDSSIAEIDEKVDKHKDQLFLVTNNKQYDALQLEIDHLKNQKDEFETKLLELAEEKDSLEEKTKDEEENLGSLSQDLSSRREKLELLMEESSEEKKQLEENKDSPKEESIPGEQPVQVSRKAQEWASKNEWFGTDRVLTGAAMAIHEELVGQGIETESDEYYNEVDSRLRKYFPDSFDTAKDEPKKETPKPVQTVASAGRSQQGRRTVKLTKSQVAIAKRLGVPLEEYARYVKEDK